MTNPPSPVSAPPGPPSDRPSPLLLARSVVGGLLMGFANVVPGISGGAMLLMVGVYQRFINAVADITTLRLRLWSIVLLGLIGSGAGVSILLSAGPIKDLVLTHRWQTFSVFIGLRLGAIPIVWRLTDRWGPRAWAGVAFGLVLTFVLAGAQYGWWGGGGGSAAGDSTTTTRFAAGLVGASATILPGMDGSYFLLLMGEYVPILSGIDRFKEALLRADLPGMLDAAFFLAPVAVGVGLGLGGVSLLLRWLFRHHHEPTAGVLMGILVGAIGGLWPFREGVPPQPGEIVRGVTVTAENAATIDKEHWAMAFFSPTPAQIGLSVAFALAGVAVALLFSRIDPGDTRAVSRPAPPAPGPRA